MSCSVTIVKGIHLNVEEVATLLPNVTDPDDYTREFGNLTSKLDLYEDDTDGGFILGVELFNCSPNKYDSSVREFYPLVYDDILDFLNKCKSFNFYPRVGELKSYLIYSN